MTLLHRFSLRRGAVVSTWRLLVVLYVVAWSAGCASYTERTREALADFERGQFDRAYSTFRESKETGSEFLSGAEAGTVALVAGRFDDSVRELDRAMAVTQDAEREALLSAGNLEDWLLSWTLNEGVKRYVGEGYERALLHATAAIARLGKGDLEGARVESRRANQLLESEEELYKKEYMAGGLGHFLSALFYELDGKPDEAFIDYARMRSKGVGLALAGSALVRLGRVLGRDDEVEELERQFGAHQPLPEGAASIVVIGGIGMGPFKREHSLLIPTPDGVLSWSVPTFERRPTLVGDLELSVEGGDTPVRTIVVEDVGVVAKENLEDRLLMLSAKSAVRAVLKRELTQKLESEAGLLGRIAGDVFSILTERADLRSWTTLPDTWQAARVFVPAGSHSMRLSARGGESVELGTFELDRGETVFVIARTLNTRVYAHTVGGKRVPVAASPTEAPAPGALP
ncbi:MAG: hypothetical protein IPJ77_22525 [Planctomycetes bacterium]|nr:hypothetical protein [Planctomycetota bacterium]